MAEASPSPRRRSADWIRYLVSPRASPWSITDWIIRGTTRLSPVRINNISRVANMCQKYGLRKNRIWSRCLMAGGEGYHISDFRQLSRGAFYPILNISNDTYKRKND